MGLAVLRPVKNWRCDIAVGKSDEPDQPRRRSATVTVRIPVSGLVFVVGKSTK